MKSIVVGIVAHVDAGKTTLTEGLLYSSGAIDRLGRVDKRDAYLDTHSLERERGITIFSKQALLDFGDTHVTLIDTPGHVDFSCECERALAIEDYAILVISATDGVTAHTRTLWSLLRERRIPTFIFINKCDIAERRRDDLLSEVRCALDPHIVDFTKEGEEEFFEACASSDTHLMTEYFDTGATSTENIAEAIRRSSLYPCYFGSALKLSGVSQLLEGLDRYTLSPAYPDITGARIYKIDRDKDGRRIAFAKVTGGSLKPKTVISYTDRYGVTYDEKIEELRLFNGDRSQPLKEARPGTVAAIYGTTHTEAGMGIGFEANDRTMLEPVLDYRIILDGGQDPYEAYLKLAPLGEEDPSLKLKYDTEAKEIRVSLMGEIQLEVLTEIIERRFGFRPRFDEGKILYRETVTDVVYGSGHFEPLMHYAEVHLRLEPLPEGSGIVAATECSQDELGLSWQRLVMTHIGERIHRGVLTGSPLTDVKITLIAGKAHLKHTSGGDFRQATYRAIRQAIRKAERDGLTTVLEPSFNYRIELPEDNLGRAMNDITNMRGTVDAPEFQEGVAILTGVCPVETMRSYATVLRAYTRGASKLHLTIGEYIPVDDPTAIIEKVGYDADRDERQTADSVFCKGGSGYTVPWYEADELMHIRPDGEEDIPEDDNPVPHRARASTYRGTVAEDRELERIFEATYGKIHRKQYSERAENKAPSDRPKRRTTPPKRGDEYIVIDGYNLIYAWDELRPSARVDFSLSRELLIRMMCSYSAFKRCRVIIVFDAYRVKDGKGSTEKYGDVTVVYTRERETADAYIERATYKIAPTNHVRVVTSDLEEQYIILGNGALRVSPTEWRRELSTAALEIEEYIEKYSRRS